VTACCLALYGTYANWLVTLIAAAFGTAANSPITSAGQSGQPWQESIVAIGFLAVTIALIAMSILVLWGLRGTAAEVNDSWKGWSIRNSTFPDRRKDAVMSLLTAQHSRRNPGARLLDSKHWLDSPFDAQGR
jgi:hypothetical protein